MLELLYGEVCLTISMGQSDNIVEIDGERLRTLISILWPLNFRLNTSTVSCPSTYSVALFIAKNNNIYLMLEWPLTRGGQSSGK